ncbi:MAG: pantoate--beta-alanine ligase [Proteobacteria bacterium]|nr:pantoate--beta-alanine ligase [Pseudomonadota bacterium]
MLEVSTSEALREQLVDWRHSGEHIALVPTMGNLHDGHLGLVSLAREHAERVVVSIFVNPTQFGEGDDFDQYPRTLERDRRRLKTVKADLLFVPDEETMYPFGIDNATSVTVPVITAEFCGVFRPGHFDGVTSVVSRLFSLVQPDVAIFGQKDFQQQLVIRRLVDDLQLPIQIVSGATQREADGLALSSRNQYLSDEQRAIAPTLYSVLQGTGNDLQAGKRNYEELEQQAIDALRDAGFDPEYVGIRRAENLEPPDRDNDEIVILAAARLGTARLIDNIIVAI